MKIAIYVRARADAKLEEDRDCADQIAALHQWAATQGHQVIACFEDRGASANDVRRPGLAGLLHAAFSPSPRFEALCVTNLDRLLRDAFALEVLEESLKCAAISILTPQNLVEPKARAQQMRRFWKDYLDRFGDDDGPPQGGS